MKEIRNKRLQERLNLIKEGKQDERSVKRRKRTYTFIIIDALIILLIFMFFYKNTPENIYESTSINHDKIEYRFSLSSKNKEDKFYISLTITSRADKKKFIRFKKNIGRVTLINSDMTIWESEISKNTDSLSLTPSETKTYVSSVSKTIMKNFIRDNKKSLSVHKKSMFSFNNRQIPITAKIDINTEKSVSTTVKFIYEVD